MTSSVNRTAEVFIAGEAVITPLTFLPEDCADKTNGTTPANWVHRLEQGMEATVREGYQIGYGAGVEPITSNSDLTAQRLTIALAWASARNARSRIAEGALFVDPAWDIMLILYIAHAQDNTATFEMLGSIPNISAATLSRWVTVVVSHDLAVRSDDAADPKTGVIGLSPNGLRLMEETLDASADSDANFGLGRLRVIR